MSDPRIEPIAIAICASRHRNHNAKVDYWAISGEYARSQYMDDATAAVAAIDKAATITTSAELMALPYGTVIKSRLGTVRERLRTGWLATGADRIEPPEHVLLPARVIHWGTE